MKPSVEEQIMGDHFNDKGLSWQKEAIRRTLKLPFDKFKDYMTRDLQEPNDYAFDRFQWIKMLDMRLFTQRQELLEKIEKSFWDWFNAGKKDVEDWFEEDLLPLLKEK